MHALDDVLASLPNRLHQIIERHGQTQVALYEGGVALTYGELRHAVDDLTLQFSEAGIRSGDRMMLVAENSRVLVAAFLALSRLDAWAVVVNARLSVGEIETIRAHCGARRMLFSSAVSADAAKHALNAKAELREHALLGRYHLGPLNPDCKPEPVQADAAEQVAALIYTTGTTGAPKGVMLTHRNLLYVARLGGLLRKLSSADRIYAVLPMSHVFGLSSVCLAGLFSGAALQLEARFDPLELIRALREDGISMLLGVPAMFAKLLELADKSAIELKAPALRFMYAGGSPLDMALKNAVEQRFASALHNGYGLTETSPTISCTRISEIRRDTSVGRPVPGMDTRLLNAARTEVVASGEVGELWVCGPGVMKGYYRAAAQTAEVLTADGWLNTGDLAQAGSDGALFIVGRSKELIIRSGFNVYPPEVEAALNAYPGVVLSAVVGKAVPGNEEVIAFIQVANPEQFDLAGLSGFLAERLSAYKLPSQIKVLEALPAAATGKILKHELKAQATAL